MEVDDNVCIFCITLHFCFVLYCKWKVLWVFKPFRKITYNDLHLQLYWNCSFKVVRLHSKAAFWKSGSKCSKHQYWNWRPQSWVSKLSWACLTDYKRPNFSHNTILTKCVATAFYLTIFKIVFLISFFKWQYLSDTNV